jgi:internalin A
MTLKELKFQAKNFISEARTDLSLDLVLYWANRNDNKEVINDIILLKNNWFSLNVDIDRGRISFSDETIRRNQLNSSLLGVLDYLEDESINLSQQLIRKAKEQRLIRLDIGNCGLTELPDELFELVWLEELILSNEWDEYSFEKKKWEHYSSLNKGEANNIKSLNTKLKVLRGLKKLIVGGVEDGKSNLSDLSPLKELTQLQMLLVSSTEVSDLNPLKELKQLQIIHVSSTLISDLSPLKNLTQLKFLSCTITEVSDLSALKDLKELQALFLSMTQVSDLSPLKDLKLLQTLHASTTLVRDLSPLKDLKQLQTLILYTTEVSDLSPLKNLTQLQMLNFSQTQVSDLSPLKDLKRLQELNLSMTQASDLMPLIGLTQLQELNLAMTQVSDLSPLKYLSKLKSLNVQSCNVTKIEPIKDIKLHSLNLWFNPIEDCSKEIYETNDIKQIRVWFEQNNREKSVNIKEIEIIQAINGVKLIFIGNSAVGKTQLIEYITTGEYKDNRESTHGIILKNWKPIQSKSIPIFQKELKDKLVNIWDFGGQEYYHGTHRLFLSNRAVYVLLFDYETNINGRRDTLITDLDQVDLEHFEYHYWLDSIRAFAPESPILMLQNKIDAQSKIRIQHEDYADYKLEELHHISLREGAKGNDNIYRIGLEKSFYDLIKLLKQEAEKSSFPNWMPIVEELRKVRDDNVENAFKRKMKHEAWLTLGDFIQTCEKILNIKFSEDEKHTLPRWLNNVGEVLFFYDNPQLNDRVFVNPKWVTDTIYTILNDSIKKDNGIFKAIELTKNHPKLPIAIILEMMLQMELIFKNKLKLDEYIAPQYLADKHPIEDLYKMVEKGLKENGAWIQLPLFFYKKLMHELLIYFGTHEQVDARYFWKHGIVFDLEGVRVLIKGLYPLEDEREGKILIGVEVNPKSLDIQKKVFSTMLKVLFDTFSDKKYNVPTNNKLKIASIDSMARMIEEENEIINSEIIKKGYYLFKFELDDYIKNPQKIPRWLKNLQISVNGEDFVNYLTLYREHQNNNPSVQCTYSDKILKVNAFSTFLDQKGKKTLKVFFSYSHTDMDLMQRLHIHLAPLRRMDRIATWSDREILPGSDWDSTIQENLKTADIILLLVSADFVASNYIWEKELNIALEREARGEAKVLPILLRPLDFSTLKIAEKQMIPKNEESGKLRPVSLWADKEEALSIVAIKIREAIESL